jgi:hypothetical protein
MEDSLEETKTLVENKKERENFIDLHRNIFVITEKVELPPQERRISLLMESCNEFADSASFDTNESYRQALEIASRQAYTVEDIILVSKRLGEFSGHDRFNSIGFYLSALVNHIANPGDSLQFDFRYLDEMKGKNKDLKFLDGIGAFNRSADLGVKGTLGNQAGYHFAGGSLKGDSAGNYTAEEQEAGIITFNKILHYGGTCKSGGELIVAEAGDSLGYRMKNNGIIKAVSAHDCLGEEIAGGLIEAETAKDEVGKRGKKGVIRLLKSYSSLADDIGKEVQIYCGNARVR